MSAANRRLCFKVNRRSALERGLPLAGLIVSTILVGGDRYVRSSWFPEPERLEELHSSAAEHANQMELRDLVVAGKHEEAFEEAFELGDDLFDTVFNALDGVGANVGNGQRFTRMPRADLTARGQWADHSPPRITGPNARSCTSCHNTPFEDGAGRASSNVHRDPLHSAAMWQIIERNTPHVFAPGALQRLAEEMTEELHRIRDEAAEEARQRGRSVQRRLRAKGVDFGSIGAEYTSSWRRDRRRRLKIDTSRVEGVDADLVVKPFQWKGVTPTVRDFNRGASHNELGMQPVEVVGSGVDGDYDGVVDEMTIGDQTALAVYLAAQPRPTSTLELSELGVIPPLDAGDVASIRRGEDLLELIGCADCHMPKLTIDDPIFSEPSRNENFRDQVFPSGQEPVAHGVDPQYPITFDLTSDQPDNVITDKDGNEFRLGSLLTDGNGGAIVALYSDLKRHEMGTELAEGIADAGIAASVFMTEALWGVGSTAPYMHDGRATTLTEAILAHGGEAARSRERFEDLPLSSKKDLMAFLDNLVLFKLEEE